VVLLREDDQITQALDHVQAALTVDDVHMEEAHDVVAVADIKEVVVDLEEVHDQVEEDEVVAEKCQHSTHHNLSTKILLM